MGKSPFSHGFFDGQNIFHHPAHIYMAYMEVENGRRKESNHITKANANRDDEILFENLNSTKEKTKNEWPVKTK